MFIGTLQHGSCLIQPTSIGFSSGELIDMVRRCGLNRLNQFASFLSVHFRNARQDAKLLSMLLSLDDVLYSGLPLSQEDEQWALKIGIKIRVSHSSIIITLYFLKNDNFVRIYLVAQKSERCYSPVGTTKTLPYSKPFPAPHTGSSQSTRPKRKVSTNPMLGYMNSLFLPIHRTAPAFFDTRTAIFIPVTSSNKCPRGGIYSVAETMIGSNQRAVFDATPGPLKITLTLCVVT